MKILNLAGKVFGRLTAIEPCGTKFGGKLWRCICECGNEKITSSSYLVHGNTKSCGCLVADNNKTLRLGKPAKNRTHGASKAGERTPEYVCWLSMRQRCSDENHISFKNYGAKGISVCERWQSSFETFLSDMGKRPTMKHSIDRYPDQNGNYEPSNVRWATRTEQGNNKTNNRAIKYTNGETMTVSEVSRLIGVPLSTMHRRVNEFDNGVISELDLFATIKRREKPFHNGETKQQIADRLGISITGLNFRLRRVAEGGFSIEEAVSKPHLRNPANL